MKSTSIDHAPIRAPREKREVWEHFRNDKELLDRLNVTHDELEALEHCALLGTLSGKEDLLFILRQIREPRSSLPEEASPSPAAPSYEVPIEEPEDPMPLVAPRANPSAATNLRDPASFAAISRNRRLEHFGILLGAISLIAIVMWNLLGGLSAWHEHFLMSIRLANGQRAMAAAASNPGGSVSKLVMVEILAIGVIALFMHLRSRKSHRRFKVKPT